MGQYPSSVAKVGATAHRVRTAVCVEVGEQDIENKGRRHGAEKDAPEQGLQLCARVYSIGSDDIMDHTEAPHVAQARSWACAPQLPIARGSMHLRPKADAFFQAEQHAANGRAEDRGHARRSAAGDKVPLLGVLAEPREGMCVQPSSGRG